MSLGPSAERPTKGDTISTTTHPPTLIEASVSTGIPNGEARYGYRTPLGAPAFAIARFSFQSLQPIAGVVLTVAAFTIAPQGQADALTAPAGAWRMP